MVWIPNRGNVPNAQMQSEAQAKAQNKGQITDPDEQYRLANLQFEADESKDYFPLTSPESIDRLNQISRWHQQNEQQLKLVEEGIKKDPNIYQPMKDAILDNMVKPGALQTAEVVTRLLTLPLAITTGLQRGWIKSMKGEGTVYDQVIGSLGLVNPIVGMFSQNNLRTVAESVIHNYGYDKVLEDLGFKPGEKIQVRMPSQGAFGGWAETGANIAKALPNVIPGINMPTPSAIGNGLAKAIIKGDLPSTPFSPVMTSRGAIGLALDFALDPVTYLSFGMNKGIKQATEAGRSVVRIFNQPMLYDKEWTEGIKALKASNMGRTVLEFMDRYSASRIGELLKAENRAASTGENIALTVQRAFEGLKDAFIVPHNNISNLGYKVDKQITQNAVGIYSRMLKMFADIPKELQIEYGKAALARMERLSKGGMKTLEFVPEAGLPAIEDAISLTPRLKKIHDELMPYMQSLAEAAGLPRERIYSDYFPSMFREYLDAAQRTTRMGGKYGAKIGKISGFMKKEFVQRADLVTDPVEAFTRRAIELMTAERIKNGFIGKIVKQYGKSKELVTQQGLNELFPLDVRKVFGGTKWDYADILSKVEDKIPTESQYLPQIVLDKLEHFAKNQKVAYDSFGILKMYDKYSNFMRRWLTYRWPSFNFRNLAISNIIQRFETQGFSSFRAEPYSQAYKIMTSHPGMGEEVLTTKTGKVFSLSKIRQKLIKDQVLDMPTLGGELGYDSFNLSPEAMANAYDTWMNRSFRKRGYGATMQHAAYFGEAMSKAATYIQALKDGATFKEAKNIALQTLFDYTAHTAFERNVMRRIFLFYQFRRKNIPLQINTFLKNPGRQSIYFKTMKDLRDMAQEDLTDEQKEALLELKDGYINRGVAIPVGYDKKTDNFLWFSAFGAPQEDFVDIFNTQSLQQQLNPALKMGSKLLFMMAQKETVPLDSEYYTLNELKLFFPKSVRTKLAGKVEDVNEFLTNKVGATWPIQKFFKFRAVAKNVYDKQSGWHKEMVFQADRNAIEVLQGLNSARFMSSLRLLGNENADAKERLQTFLTGIQLSRANAGYILNKKRKAKEAAMGKAMQESGTGRLNTILVGETPIAKQVSKLIEKQKFK